LPSEPRTRPNPTWHVFGNLSSLGSGSQPAILTACRKTTENSIKEKEKNRTIFISWQVDNSRHN